MLEMASLDPRYCRIRSSNSPASTRCGCACFSSLTPPELPIAEEAASGTLITFEEDADMEQALVSGIAFNRDEAKSPSSRARYPRIAYQILDPIAVANIEVDVIVQNIGKDGLTDFSFTTHRNDLKKTLDILEKVRNTSRTRSSSATTDLQGRVGRVGCVRMSGWPARCSARWRKRASTSR